jgi:glycosyltransferase involved in cell wall biosynthesis
VPELGTAAAAPPAPAARAALEVLLLCKYDRSGASSRVRSHQFLPYLEAHGIRVRASPLFPPPYLERLYRGSGRAPLLVARSYARRLAALAGARRFPLVWIEKEALPWVPAPLERLLLAGRLRYVLDLDDAVFHRYDQSRHRAVRALLGRKIDRLLRGAALVTAGSRYLAERAEAAGARRVVLLPSVVDPARYPAAPPAPGRGFAVGWIGSPLTFGYVADIAPALARFCRQHGATLRLVGAGSAELPGVPTARADWSESEEPRLLASFDVGIMPLRDRPFERGKCGYKLLQYMAVGRPVVASPVGANREIVTPAVGFLAATSAEWVARLAALRGDPALRAAMGQAGRRRVEERYALGVAAPRLRDALLEAAGGAAGAPGR